MPQTTQTSNWRDILKKHRGKFELGGLFLSTGVGAGIGALLGTLVFPGFGTAAGALIGGGFGASSSLFGICMARTIVQTSNQATGTNVFGVLFSSMATGGLIGGLIGSFVFPLVGTGFGAAIGICIAAVAGLALFFAVHAIPAVRRCRLETQMNLESEEQNLLEQLNGHPAQISSQRTLDPGANSYCDLYRPAPVTGEQPDPLEYVPSPMH